MTQPIEVEALSHAFDRRAILRDLTWSVPSGAFYALLGPNGAGKTTLLRLIAGILPPQSGAIRVFGAPRATLPRALRERIGYVAEGRHLPEWMRLRDLEAYHAPLYPTWDRALADHLRNQFQLESTQRIGQMSRGQRMKAALLCALAYRPALLLMDEPFTGLDVAVKDELVRGLLDSAAETPCTVVISTHDIGEVDALADWVAFLRDGQIVRSGPMDVVRDRFHRVHLTLPSADAAPSRWPAGWMEIARTGSVVSALVESHESLVIPADISVTHIDIRPASLKEVYLATQQHTTHDQEVRA